VLGVTSRLRGRKYRVNLICLPLVGLDVILGMDWLSTNHHLIHCNERKLLFPSLEDEDLLMSSQQVDKAMKEGSRCFLILTQLSIETEIGPLEAPVVGDFLDVFLEDVPGLPPTREIKFSIDLVPGAGPVSITPYKMVLAELVELKKQIEELLEKQFIRPSVSS